MPYVVVQEDGASKPLADWPVDLSTADSLDDAQELVDACSEIARFAVKTGKTGFFNVFLIFDVEELLIGRDRPGLARLIAATRARTWGARLFLVLCNAPWLATIPPRSRTDLGDWMNELVSGKIVDVLQPAEPLDIRTLDRFCSVLRDGAGTIRERQTILKKVAGGRKWCCVLPERWNTLADALGADLANVSHPKKRDLDVVVVLEASKSLEASIEDIERELAYPTRRCIVATYAPVPSRGLIDYCNDHHLLPPIAVAGDFELWYLLLRLNDAARAHVVDTSDLVQMVPLVASPRLNSAGPPPPPSILLTSVFPGDEIGQLLAASGDVGELVVRTPLEMTYRVELAVDPARLADVLEHADPNVWIHMGHGNGPDGLRIPGAGDIHAEKWVLCFAGRDLRLAMFLTCHSDEIARCFGSEGAVGIGFMGQVHSTDSRPVATEVLKAIVAHGTHEDVILEGFRAGVARYESARTGQAQPRAYHARRT